MCGGGGGGGGGSFVSLVLVVGVPPPSRRRRGAIQRLKHCKERTKPSGRSRLPPNVPALRTPSSMSAQEQLQLSAPEPSDMGAERESAARAAMPKALQEPPNYDELMADNLLEELAPPTSLSPRVMDIDAAASRAGMDVDFGMYADAVGIINVSLSPCVCWCVRFPSLRSPLSCLLFPSFPSSLLSFFPPFPSPPRTAPAGPLLPAGASPAWRLDSSAAGAWLLYAWRGQRLCSWPNSSLRGGGGGRGRPSCFDGY